MKKFFFTLTFFLSFLLFKKDIQALEIAIEGNGNGSQNEVSGTVSQETIIEQSNQTEVTNNIQSQADTGNNQVDGNTNGDVNIQTGNVESQTQVTNQLNTANVTSTCCGQDTLELSIVANGSDSDNNIDLTVSEATDVSVNQLSVINNHIEINANTGYNSANHNNGNVDIHSGDIEGQITIENAANASLIAVGNSSFYIQALIKANGENSDNQLRISINDLLNIERFNQLQLVNDIDLTANTGWNEADGNNGDVTIDTGDINFGIDVKNDPINSGGVVVTCCNSDPDDPEDPGQPVTPPPATGGDPGNGGGSGSSSSGSSSSSSNGGSGGSNVLALAGSILPATGSIWMLLALLANVMMFLMGLYLRLRSGRSPAYLPVTV